MKPKRMLTLALGAFVLICGVQSGIAQIGISAPPGRQPNTINLDSLLRGRQVNVDNLEQFRGEWLTLIAMLEELHPGDRVSGFEPRVSVEQLSGLKGTIENLPTEELRLMAMWADRERLSNAVEQLEASLPEEAFGTHDKTIGPEPVRAALPGVTPDATCGSTRSDVALIQGFIIAFEVTEALAILAEVACETIIGEPASGGAKTAACVAMGVAKGLSLAAAVVIDLADFCDSVIDGVEIKGTLDNTVHIHTDLTTHDSNCPASAGNGEQCSAVTLTEGTHEKNTKALHSPREGRHSEAASGGQGAGLEALRRAGAAADGVLPLAERVL